MQKYDFLGTLNIKNILSTLNIKYIFKYTKILLFLLKYILVENVFKKIAKKKNKQKKTPIPYFIYSSLLTFLNVFLFYLYRLTRCSLSLSLTSNITQYSIIFPVFPFTCTSLFPGSILKVIPPSI